MSHLFKVIYLQRVPTQHGKVLGGSSSINWMLYVRGHRLDYDSWAKLGCTGWDWENVQNYFKKMEDYFLPNGNNLLLLRLFDVGLQPLFLYLVKTDATKN